MNPLQRYSILQSIRSAAASTMLNEPPRTISTAELIELVNRSNGLPAEQTTSSPTPQTSPSALRADVALCVGGGGDPLAEYEAALKLCLDAGKTVENYVCNDMLTCFPGVVHHGATLHPDLWPKWKRLRMEAGLPLPLRMWAHRAYPGGFTDHTKDWQGSSGLFLCKIAREQGHTHIILAGVPMTVEGRHFIRRVDWGAAEGFRKGWARVQGSLRPFVRSMSGWTMAHFGAPTVEWLNAAIPDRFPMRAQHGGGYKA